MLPTWVTELETPGSASRDAPAATPPSAPVNAPRGPRWADQRRQFGRPVPNSEPPQCRGSALSGQRLTSSPSGRAFGGRGIGPRPPNPPPGVQYYGVVPFEWRTSRVAVLVLKGIESFTTTLDIFLTLHTHGNIVRIEIDDPNSQRGVSRTARVRFEPAPHSISFFEQGYCMMQGENRYWVGVDFPPQSDNGRSIRTPTGNLCPERLVLGLPGLSFGLLIDPTSFLVKKKLQYSANSMLGESKLTVDYKRKNLLVNFAVKSHGDIPDHIQRNTNRSQRSDQNHRGSDRAQSHGPDQTQSKTTEFPRYQHYRVEMKFSNIQGLSLVKNEKYSGLVINLCSPPIVWRMRNSLTETFYPGRLVWGEREMWLRALEVSDSPIQHSTPVSLQESHQIIDFGRWTTIWLDLDTASNEILLEMRFYLKDWNIHLRDDRDRDTLKQTWDRTPELWALLDEVGKALPFDVRYQLEVCVSHGVLSEYNVKRDFIDKLVELSHVRIMEFNRARLALEYAAEDKRILYNPMELFDNEAAMRYLPTTASLPDHCALVRKATITPTRIYFSTPTVETTNRVIRQFKSVQDSFLRIQFTDEVQEGQIHGCEDDRDDQIFHRAFRVMAHGIKMGDIHWKFLAFGNSQIRENGAYFFNEPGLGDNGEAAITCHTLRHWMGRFSHIKVIAKYAARLGQCLSTTRALPTVSAPHIIKIEDVESGKFCFTDGVGKISASLAKLVGQDWGIPPPSAIQFRMGGCKGVLVVWPDVSGTDIHIRKSQEKFLAEYNGLEVIRCSQYACATLNRQTITILSSLGVPDQVFVDIMDEQLTNYNKAMTDPKKAAELLSLFVDENQMTRTIESMILNGFMETLEPFVHALLHLWRSWSIKELKERAKLVIEEGAFVLGGVDETGTLQGHLSTTEGSQGGPKEALLPQIFLQIPDPRHGGRYRIVTGLCIVGRNPALHPGDIRVVMAVDCPMLRHIKNVVIFPLKGDCDVPSMCSGGDLDGDDFFVIWDERLLPKQWSHPPMNYTPAPPMEEPEGVTANGLKHFFVLFIKHNTLPLIAHAHLATADYEKEGPNHEKCLKLAELHSTAVDYVKTGIPAKWNRSLEPRRWPHFMEKNRRGTYHSTSALGQLYDMVKREAFDVNEGYKLPFDSRILKRYKVSNELLTRVRRIKSQYDIAMRRLMGQFDVKTEFEVWTGFIMSKVRIGSNYKVQEKVGHESYALKKQFRDLCIKASGGSSSDMETFGPFVVAMYRVTFEEVRIALYESRQTHIRPDGTAGKRRLSARSMPLISFPWIFDAVLGELAGGEAARKKAGRRASNFAPGSQAQKIQEWDGQESAGDDLVVCGDDMGLTYTSDGNIVHRGEILHLFRHEDDEAVEVEADPESGLERLAKPAMA